MSLESSIWNLQDHESGQNAQGKSTPPKNLTCLSQADAIMKALRGGTRSKKPPLNAFGRSKMFNEAHIDHNTG